MKFSAQIEVVIKLLEEFFETELPFDYIMAKFFRNNKYIGAFERREIAEISYAIFRDYERLNFFIPKASPRLLVMVFLKFHGDLIRDSVVQDTTGKVLNIFSGKSYAPSACNDFERDFLKKIDISTSLTENAKLNYPLWTEKYFRRRFEDKDEFLSEMAALNTKAKVDLRVNHLKASEETVVKLLKESGLAFEKLKFARSGFRVTKHIGRNHPLIADGLCEIQDEGSQIIAELCSAKAGEMVVDLCAGAGGKTLALADSMQNKGTIFALDTAAHRLENAKIRLRRAGAHNVFCHPLSSKWLKRHEGKMDLVLVDAPCTGVGTWRRNPDMRVRLKETDIRELTAIQYSILENAKKLLKSGGRLVYSTCSLFLEEDEDQIERFLSNNPDMELVNIIQSRLANDFSGPYLNLSAHKFGTDGFFASLMVKTYHKFLR